MQKNLRDKCHNTFPSVDEMYEDKEFEAYRTQIQNMDLNIDMHDDFFDPPHRYIQCE